MSTGAWTLFWDMHSGGSQKLDWPFIIIEADEDEARKMFAEAFGRNPDDVTCNCCGEDYSVSSDASLAQLTAYHRHLTYTAPLMGAAEWRAASPEERQAANNAGRYLEPDELPPDGWPVRHAIEVEHGYVKPQTMADFLRTSSFVDAFRAERIPVKLIVRPALVKDDETKERT